MKFLNFTIGTENYGVLLEQIVEVTTFQQFTPAPDSSDYFLGFLMQRDEVIPILDLRIRFQIEPTLTPDTAIIICNLNNKHFGVVVDSIENVSSVDDSAVSPISKNHVENSSEFVSSLVKSSEGLILILDLTRACSLKLQNEATS